MPLDRRMSRELDNYITGHYGEDQFKNEEEEEEKEEEDDYDGRVSSSGNRLDESLNQNPLHGDPYY